ncbi:hypothetical protein K2173_012437 [Erythroxylum novogranatense]|uniref:Uncharacterized protein n=1 Tax=Erythroxylum novogranatense TaxID=1862640 RepID=A0AAV8TJ81_9ROSI|nr:hypothetical protein K2173_012437 [Erythroxylum novogranatense]
MKNQIGPTSAGLVLSLTEPIRSFLDIASKDPKLSDQLRHLASALSSQPTVPYNSLRSIWVATHLSSRHDLLQLFSGSQLVFSSPTPRAKSEELKARLRKLEELAERNAYQELVKDITPRKSTHEPFSSYKDQLGFGLHVALTMFTGYLVGYASFRALFGHTPAMVMNACGNTSFIIRTSSQGPKPSTSTSKLKKNQ